jgi:hypothetical protein
MTEWSRWTRNDLIHPHKETIATDNTNGDDGPDSEGEDEKPENFLPPAERRGGSGLVGAARSHIRPPKITMPSESLVNEATSTH